ncbi:MAPEG family protein [Litoreibacter arenae]|uniref:Putative Ribosomal protein L11 n=1 Tax=Litoreibacter arenae DSM 19593 TaxID=1123360 RepID=S9QJ61_9RHOB|nr:MAPEG family protein [Litoreibacter arenae]EPX79857.1 putative Ribosomal protein L11 [Litoreibacter arenae DSM 19593]
MTKRALILAGMGAGTLWALVTVPLARAVTHAVKMPLLDALSLAFLPCGVVLLAMIGRLAQRRFFDDAIIDGEAFRAESPADIDQRVLRNTVEQGMLAVLLWPLIGSVLGGGAVLFLGASFAVTRVMFWLGYHISPPLRAFGFAAGFYPTITLLIAALVIGVDQGRFALP